MQRLIKVSIAYCSECGYEPWTLDLANTLMKTFGDDLSSIEIIPWHDGTFEVTIDGELVHSMEREGGFSEHQTIIDAVRRHQQGDAS